MANKQQMKISEARILIYLSQTKIETHYTSKISLQLNIDYGYSIRILSGMWHKEWLRKDKSLANPTRTYYHLTNKGSALLIKAKQALIK